MDTTLFPTLEEAIFLHESLIARYGGVTGIRDKGLLESALARPRSGFYESLTEQAAALMHSLINNHCFIDGNKRVGFALTAAFLIMNGHRISVSADEAETFIVEDIIKSGADVYIIASWLERHLKVR